jgi:hypothetical protein
MFANTFPLPSAKVQQSKIVSRPTLLVPETALFVKPLMMGIGVP